MALPTNQISSIGTGKDYSTVTAWEADLDDAQWAQGYIGEVYGLTEDNAVIAFDGVDPNGYTCILRAASGEEADGTDNAGAVIDVNLNIYQAINAIDFDIQGIEFYSGALSITPDSTGSVINITKCVFRDQSGIPQVDINSLASTTVNIGVCLFRNSNYVGIYHRDSDASVKVINCTFYDGYYGGPGDAGGNFVAVKNCVSMGCANSDYYSLPSNMSYCCSSDATATGTGSLVNKTYTDQWTDPANDDFTVKDTNADIYHSGTAISGESWFPSTDLVGTSWNNPPSMGCFEYVAAGSTTVAPTTAAPTTLAPTTIAPTTLAPTTLEPTTPAPTTTAPTTVAPTTPKPTTPAPTTVAPTTTSPTTLAPTTLQPTTLAPTTLLLTTLPPTTIIPTTAPPTLARRRGIRNFGFSMRANWRN